MPCLCHEQVHSQSSCRLMSAENFLPVPASIRCRISRCYAPRSFFFPPKVSLMTRSRTDSTLVGKSLACGASAFSSNVFLGSKNVPAQVVLGLFPPEVVVQ